MKLSETRIKRLKAKETVQKIFDGGGLFLRISPAGGKSWRLAYRYNGRQKLLVIGPYPAISLTAARLKREEAKLALANGQDPAQLKQDAKRKDTRPKADFSVVALEWLGQMSPLWSSSYRDAVHHRLEIMCSCLPTHDMDAISAQDLLQAIRQIESKHSIHVALLALRECRRIFRYAFATGRAKGNIAQDLHSVIGHIPPVQHFATLLDPKAIAALFAAMRTLKAQVAIRMALHMAPLVFVRAKELVTAQWAHINMDTAEWRIPGSMMKMRQMHIVPLARQTVALLRTMHAYTGNGQYVFARKNSPDGNKHISAASLVGALRRLGYNKDVMTLHGFRSMACTILNEQGYRSDWIERQLAHVERNSVRASYNYAQYLPERRRMMQDYADYLTKLGLKTMC